MGVGVVAQLVPSHNRFTRNLRETPHVHAALEKRGTNLIILEHPQQLRRGRARTIIERQRNFSAVLRATPHGRSEHGRRASERRPKPCRLRPPPRLVLRPACRVIPRNVPFPFGRVDRER